jgi:hypothetical protein
VPQMFRPELNLKKSHILYVNRHKSRRAMGDDDIEIPPSQTGSVWGAHGRLGRNLGPGPLSSSWPDRSRPVARGVTQRLLKRAKSSAAAQPSLRGARRKDGHGRYVRGFSWAVAPAVQLPPDRSRGGVTQQLSAL